VERIEAQPLRELGDKSGLVGGTKRAFADIWKRRELLRLLINRELKARYKDSNLGFVWSLFKPLSQLLIYFIVMIIGFIFGGRSGSRGDDSGGGWWGGDSSDSGSSWSDSGSDSSGGWDGGGFDGGGSSDDW